MTFVSRFFRVIWIHAIFVGPDWADNASDEPHSSIPRAVCGLCPVRFITSTATLAAGGRRTAGEGQVCRCHRSRSGSQLEPISSFQAASMKTVAGVFSLVHQMPQKTQPSPVELR